MSDFFELANDAWDLGNKTRGATSWTCKGSNGRPGCGKHHTDTWSAVVCQDRCMRATGQWCTLIGVGPDSGGVE